MFPRLESTAPTVKLLLCLVWLVELTTASEAEPAAEVWNEATDSHSTHEKTTAYVLLTESHAHYKYVESIENLFLNRTNQGLKFTNEVHREGKLAIDSSRLAEYSILQLLHALASGDTFYSLLTIELVKANTHVRSGRIRDWLVSETNIGKEVFYSAIKQYAKITDIACNENYKGVTDILLQVLKGFPVIDHVIMSNDRDTLRWLFSSGYNINEIDGQMVMAAWEKQYTGVLEEVLKNNGMSSLKLYTVMNHLLKDEKFLELIILTQSEQVLQYTLENYDVSYETVIRISISHNELSVLRLIELVDDLDWKITVNSSVSIGMIDRYQVEALKVIISMGFPINSFDDEGLTLLYRALSTNNTLMTGAVLYAGGSVDATVECNKTLLHTAAERGSLEVSTKLLELGAGLDAVDCRGLTPLQATVLLEDSSFVKKLYKKCLESGSASAKGILHFAAGNGSAAALEALIVSGAGVHGGQGSSPLDAAISNCKSANFEVLIQHGARPDFSRAKEYVIDAIRCNDTGTLTFLLSNVANISVVQSNEELFLREVVRYGRVEVLRILLSKGLSANAGISSVLPPIVEAVRRDEVEVLEALYSKGAFLELPCVVNCSSGTHPFVLLHEAARHNSLKAARWLLSADVATDGLDRSGDTALALASAQGHLGVVRELASRGANVNSKNADGMSVLQKAAAGGHLFVVRELLNLGADPQNRDRVLNRTSLHLAAGSGHQSVVMELLDRGAEIESRDGAGNTALHLAAEGGRYPVLMELLERHSEVNSRNLQGRTPLFYAEQGHHKLVIKSLKFWGGTL